jgi:RNA polymerase sigma-70 factor (ECF subfamily)
MQDHGRSWTAVDVKLSDADSAQSSADAPSVTADYSRTTVAETSLELLQKVRSGDADALNRLLERYTPALRRWAHGRLPSWARETSDTQDLVQDTLVQALKHLGTFRPEREGALQAYLRQAVMNRVRDELRRAHRRPPATELNHDIATTSPSPLEEAIGLELLEQYEAALAALRPDEREAIIARVELGQSYAQVAAALDKPTPDAARVAVSRALVRLASKMHAPA